MKSPITEKEVAEAMKQLMTPKELIAFLQNKVANNAPSMQPITDRCIETSVMAAVIKIANGTLII